MLANKTTFHTGKRSSQVTIQKLVIYHFGQIPLQQSPRYFHNSFVVLSFQNASKEYKNTVNSIIANTHELI